MAFKLKPQPKKPTAKVGKPSGSSSASLQQSEPISQPRISSPVTRPDSPLLEPILASSVIPESPLDVNPRVETSEQRPPSDLHVDKSTLLSEGSGSAKDTPASHQSTGPSPSLSPLEELAPGNSGLSKEIFTGCFLAQEALNQLFQCLASSSADSVKSREELEMLKKELKDSRAQAAQDLSDTQENLRAKLLEQQQAFDAERKKLADQMLELESSLERERKELKESLELEKTQHQETRDTLTKEAEDRVVAARAEASKLSDKEIWAQFCQYAKANDYPTPERIDPESSVLADGEEEAEEEAGEDEACEDEDTVSDL